MQPLFPDRATSGAYQSILLEMKEIERKKIWVSSRVTKSILPFIEKPMIIKKNAVMAPMPPDERNSLMMYDFHHLLRTLEQFAKVLSKW